MNPEVKVYRQRYWKLWRQKHPHVWPMYEQFRRLAFPERDKANAANRRSRPDVLEKIRIRSQEWRNRNPDKSRKSSRAQYAKNPHAFIFRNRVRQHRKKFASPGDQSLVKAIYARAAELRRWFDVVVDHIIPLARGGLHQPENLQIIYRLENMRKGVRLDFQPSVIFV